VGLIIGGVIFLGQTALGVEVAAGTLEVDKVAVILGC
jgi:hypothetical protein